MEGEAPSEPRKPYGSDGALPSTEGAFDMDAHDPFQEREIEAVLLETKRDLAAGQYVSESVSNHIRRILGEI